MSNTRPCAAAAKGKEKVFHFRTLLAVLGIDCAGAGKIKVFNFCVEPGHLALLVPVEQPHASSHGFPRVGDRPEDAGECVWTASGFLLMVDYIFASLFSECRQGKADRAGNGFRERVHRRRASGLCDDYGGEQALAPADD